MEDFQGILQSLIGFLGASGLVSGLVLRRIDRLEKKLDAHEQDRVEENVMRVEALTAAGRLSEANTLALRAITSEEACEAELTAHREASTKLDRFMREKSAVYLHAK